MILKQLYLKIGDLGLPTEFTYGFLKRSRYVCNYVEREVLAKLRYRTENFDRIVISASSAPQDGVFVNTANAACTDVPYDRGEYERRSGDDLGVYYIGLLRAGLDKTARFVAIPKQEIFDGLDAFVAGGMKNEWVHKERLFRQPRLRAALSCALTQDAFTLRLTVRHGDERVFDEEILRTDPDENAFGYRFKDVVIDGDYLTVTGRTGEPLWRERVSALTG
jgi:hypothetical protein